VLNFFNQVFTKLQIWLSYGHSFPYYEFILLPSSIFVAFDIKTVIFGSFFVLIATVDTGTILWNQFMVWYSYGYLYVNELMVKKFALLGCSILILAQRYQVGSKMIFGSIPFASGSKEMSTRKSAIMLVGRLFMSVLFLYVGVTEIQRQLANSEQHHHRHGDGHDNLPCKLIEFLLSLPLVVGFKTNLVARLLAIVLVAEAFSSWSWWTSDLNIGYVLHAREHFTVNVGVAGGMLLLSFVGAGKFTVDEMLKKNE